MMGVIEYVFDLGYLVVVIYLGLRLLLCGVKEGRIFELMAILLGVGDGFHPLPRVISHMTENGFEVYQEALSGDDS